MTEKRFFLRGKKYWKNLIVDHAFTDINTKKLIWLMGLGLSEMMGIWNFMVIGCGGSVQWGNQTTPSVYIGMISFSLGMATSIMILGPISGGVMHPGLNLTAVILGRMSIQRFFYYAFFELLGSSLAVLYLTEITPGSLPQGFCVVRPGEGIQTWQAFSVDFFAQSVLSLLICSHFDPRNVSTRGILHLKFGLAVLGLTLMTCKYNCGLNPARTFGPALVMWDWEYQWIYWASGMSSCAIMPLVYLLFFNPESVEALRKNPPVDKK